LTDGSDLDVLEAVGVQLVLDIRRLVPGAPRLKVVVIQEKWSSGIVAIAARTPGIQPVACYVENAHKPLGCRMRKISVTEFII